MHETESKPGGLLASFRRIADSLLGMVYARVSLFSLEFEAEKLRLLDVLLKLAVALAFCVVGLIMGTLTLAIYVWEVARYRGLLAMTAILLAAGCFLLWRIRKEAQKSSAPFSKTLAEFKKDRECLQKKD